MAEYEVGNIDIVFRTLSQDTINSIERTIDALKRLKKQINNISKIDMQRTYKSFNQLTRIITPFIDKVISAEQPLRNFSNAISLTRVNSELDLTNAKIEKLKAQTSVLKTREVLNGKKIELANNKLATTKERLKNINKNTGIFSKMFHTLFKLSKLYLAYNYATRVARAFMSIAEASINFEETLNKFQVSFGEFSNEATKFANQMAYAFNSSTESIMNYMATFNSMLSSLGGLSGSQSFQLSKTLTQLSIDYASLFNVSIQTSMEQFQSVLAGQIRSIRTTSGVDVSDLTILQLYQEMGGQKTQRQLTQLEKRLLRIYAVEKQMDSLGAVGDYEKTLNSASNVLKQITETAKELAKWFGDIVMNYAKPLLTNTLSFLLVLKEITKYFAIINGFLTTQYSNENKNALFGNKEEIDETTESVKELMGLLSFDKFEALKSNSSSLGLGGDVDLIASKIKDTVPDFSKIRSEARKTADEILKWLGLVEQVDKETKEITWVKLDQFTNLDRIRMTINAILSLGIAKFVNYLIFKLPILSKTIEITNIKLFTLKSILSTIGKISIVAGIWLLIEGLQQGNKALIVTGSILLAIATTLKVISALKVTKSIFDNKILTNVYSLTKSLGLLQSKLIGIGIALGFLTVATIIVTQCDKWSAKTKVLVGVLATLTSVLFGVASGIMAVKGAMTLGTAVPIILGSIALGVAGLHSLANGVKEFADGGFPTKGNLFIANEKGPELVGNIGGRSAVANNDMIVSAIENASYRGMTKAIQVQNGNKDTIEFSFSGTRDSSIARALSQPMIDELKRQGYKVQKA